MIATRSRPVRVLELRSAWGAGGGPEKTILLSAARHDRSRVRPIVAYLRGPHDAGFAEGIRARAREAGTRILEVCDRSVLDPVCLGYLRRLARRADVIHTHDYKTDVLGLLLGRGGGRAKLLATAHGWTGESVKVRLYKRVDLLALRQYDRVIAVCDATRRTLLGGGVDDARIEVVRNAIDDEAWRPGIARDLREELGIPRATPVVATVTRLSFEKGVDLLIDVAREAVLLARARGLPRPVFLVAGDGPLRAELEEHARWWGVGDVVRFLGQRRDVARVLETADAFVLPSRVENMPNALLEAMALARPCVAFSVGGIPETMGVAGRLVPGLDTGAFAREVVHLLGDPERRRELGALARRRIEAEFSFARRLQRMEDLYEELARAVEAEAPPRFQPALAGARP